MTIGSTRVTIQRATSDNYNDRTWTDHHQIDGCVITPITGTEIANSGGIELTDNRNLFAPVGADVTAYDRVLVHPVGVVTVPSNDHTTRRANTYEVVGTPTDWLNIFTGWHPGIQVALQKVSP